ncbi:hypothetical protein GQX74_001999 [Glossina fuscipes]|nr:hypothetical protein GQX74_001999 [Glossina fuscipes]
MLKHSGLRFNLVFVLLITQIVNLFNTYFVLFITYMILNSVEKKYSAPFEQRKLQVTCLSVDLSKFNGAERFTHEHARAREYYYCVESNGKMSIKRVAVINSTIIPLIYHMYFIITCKLCLHRIPA